MKKIIFSSLISLLFLTNFSAMADNIADVADLFNKSGITATVHIIPPEGGGINKSFTPNQRINNQYIETLMTGMVLGAWTNDKTGVSYDCPAIADNMDGSHFLYTLSGNTKTKQYQCNVTQIKL